MTFSSSVMWLQRLKLWNTMPSRERMRSIWRRSAGTVWPWLSAFRQISSPLTRISAAGRDFQAFDAAQQRRLARTAAADDGDDFAVPGRQRNALQDVQSTELLVQVLDVDRLGGRLPRIAIEHACLAHRQPLRRGFVPGTSFIRLVIPGYWPCPLRQHKGTCGLARQVYQSGAGALPREASWIYETAGCRPPANP